MASDNLFPTIKSSQGNNCSKFFVGNTSDRWSVYLFKKESKNGIALQDYYRQVGVPPDLKTDNAQSELGKTRTENCLLNCIEQATTEPHPTW